MHAFGRNARWGWVKYICAASVLLFFSSCGGASNGSDVTPADISVVFPTTDASVALEFDFSATGSGDNLIGSINIGSSQGTIVINNQTLNTVIYANIPWESSGYNLYQGIALSDTDFFVYWLYCSIGNNSLDRIFYESADQYGMTQESASGSCDPRESASQPTFSAMEKNVGINRLVSGYSISGSDISLNSGQSGTLIYNGTTFALYPFDSVDCSDCSDGPWWELHSIAYDDIGQRACFTILYLFSGSDSVFSSYSICLPDLNNINAALSGTWVSPNISYGVDPELNNSPSDAGIRGIPPPQLRKR